MWNHPQAQRVLRLRLILLDADRPIERVVEVGAEWRLEALHGVIKAVFAWSGRARHVFTDRRSADPSEPWPQYRQQRVWEMEHHCRDRGHVSECEWTSTIGAVLDSRTGEARGVGVFYEYAVEERCPAHEYGSGCLLAELGVCEPEQLHGWTVAIEVLEERKARRAERLPTLLDGRGRAPLEETGSAEGDAALNALLDDPSHPRHAELDRWTRDLIGPWGEAGTRAFDPDRFDASVAAQALDLTPGTPQPALPKRLVGAASAMRSRRHRVDVLTAAARLGFEHGPTLDTTTVETTTPDTATAQRFTDGLAGWIRQVAEAEADAVAAADGSDPGERLSGVDLEFMRSLRLIWKRGGAWRVTRAGERLVDDPVGLLAQCTDGYWRAAGDAAIGLHVLLGVANGIAGDELITLVLAACSAEHSIAREWDDEDDWRMGYSMGTSLSDGAALAYIVRCRSYLARFGAFTADAERSGVTLDGFALAKSFLMQ